MKLLKRITCLLLSACLEISAIGGITARAGEQKYFPEVAPDNIPFEEMSYELPNIGEARELAEELDSLLAQGTLDSESIAAALNNLSDIFTDVYYKAALITNYSYMHPSDGRYTILSAQAPLLLCELDSMLLEAGREVLDCEVADEVRLLIAPELAAYIEANEPLTDEQQKLMDDINNLCMEYTMKVSQELTYEIDGFGYTKDELYDLASDGVLTYTDYYIYIKDIDRRFNEYIYETYEALVEKRTELAKAFGYDNYYDFAAENYFMRETTRSQVDKFKKAAKEYLLDLYWDIRNVMAYEPGRFTDNTGLMTEAYDTAELIGDVGEYIAGISPELSEAYQYMDSLNLINLYNDGGRLNYTYSLAIGNNKPYIQYGFSNIYYMAAQCLFHEFGHSNMFYYFNDSPYSSDLDFDLAEVHSASLEMLSVPFIEQHFGKEAADSYGLYLCGYQLESVIQGCIYDDFEQKVYIEGFDSLKQLNEYYMLLQKEYGYVSEYDHSDKSYDWCLMNSLFLQPCYMISYAFSAFPAIQIYIMAKTDFDKAADTYLGLCGSGMDVHYAEALSAAGLDTPFTSKNIKGLADRLYEADNIDERLDELFRPSIPSQEEEDYKVYMIKPGDTLSRIAASHKVELEDIAAVNDIDNPSVIYAGNILLLPESAVMEKAVYTIQPGDTLYEIAKAFGASMESIAIQNDIEDMKRIYAGGVLEFEY